MTYYTMKKRFSKKHKQLKLPHLKKKLFKGYYYLISKVKALYAWL